MPKPTSQNFRSLKFSVPAGFNVDRTAGTLANVVLLAGNREAKGHGLYVDAETLATGLAVLQARKQLKGALRHLSWDEYFAQGGDRVLEFPGWFSGFSVKAEQLVAEKFEFYETFRTDPESGKAFNRIMEVAEKTPDLIGLSIEAWGYAVFVAEDGKEYGTKPDGVALKYDGVPALRITDLFFAAFVDEPAATDGLFAKFSALFGGKQRLSAKAQLELSAAFEAWALQHQAELSLGTQVPLSALSNDPLTNPDPTLSATMKIIADLKAKYTDPTRFAAAMSIVGNMPAANLASLTVGDVESQLVTVDLATANAKVTSLTAELATANGKVTALTTERDELKNKYEALKTSGKGADVNLGAPTGGLVADEPNPFVRGAHFNRTRQAELKKQDPVRYEALKAAAAALPTP